MGKPPRLSELGTIDLPVVEASGLATKLEGDRELVVVVGDRSARVGVSAIGPDGLPGEWDLIDLARLDGWPDFGDSSQFEAVAADAGSTIAFLREDPPVLLIADTRSRALTARVRLTAPSGSPLHGHWSATPNSRGEGLILLRHGRVLVAKEKKPAGLVEFCPAGTPSRGLSADDLLGPGEEWESPSGDVDFVATAFWRLRRSAKKALKDISALAVGRDRGIWMLSDKSRSLGRLRLDPPLLADDHITRLDGLWRLPEGISKPEGMAVLDDARLLVALDTDSRHGNGIVVDRP